LSGNNLHPLPFTNTMKKFLLVFVVILTIASCKNKTGIPDVSNVKVDLEIQRFDRDFFTIDSNNVLPGLNEVNRKYPILTNIFLQSILGLDSGSTLAGVKRFIHVHGPIDSAVSKTFSSTDAIKKDLHKAFQFVKYYFPQYRTPSVIYTVVGPVDALAQNNNVYTPDFLGDGFLGLSLQFYLGRDYPVYHDPFFVENVAPEYRSRRFSKEYIAADAMMLIVDDLFPDKASGKPLIEQMIEKGKQWWLLDKFLPGVPDSIKTGYTTDQMEWCKRNEGVIWSELIRNTDLNSINPVDIQTYIGEGPFTQGFNPEYSPGNLGQWIGWQIVKRFASKNLNMKPAEVMMLDARKILDIAKYKPR
jgi:hypothetical protein